MSENPTGAALLANKIMRFAISLRSTASACRLIDRFGNDREKLEAAARQLTS